MGLCCSAVVQLSESTVAPRNISIGGLLAAGQTPCLRGDTLRGGYSETNLETPFVNQTATVKALSRAVMRGGAMAQEWNASMTRSPFSRPLRVWALSFALPPATYSGSSPNS
jgi:hypothetical protein